MHAAVLYVKLMLMFCPHCRPSLVALVSLWVSKLHRYELMSNHCENPSVICSLTFLWSLRLYNEHEDFLSIWGVMIHRNTRTADAVNKLVHPHQSQWYYPTVISNKYISLLNNINSYITHFQQCPHKGTSCYFLLFPASWHTVQG